MKSFLKSIFKPGLNLKFYLAIVVFIIIVGALFVNYAYQNPTSKAGVSLSSLGINNHNTESKFSVDDIELQKSLMSISGGWVWKDTTYENDAWADAKPKKAGDFVATLDVFQKMAIKTDCNNVNAGYFLQPTSKKSTEDAGEVYEGKMKIEDPVSTKKACQGSMEQAFVTDLMKVDSYKLEELKLTLNMTGVGAMNFEREQITEGQ